MCTMITRQVEIEGTARGQTGWFTVYQANVSYDHPFQAPFEYALNIDFVNNALGPEARIAVELTEKSARALVEAILAALSQAEAGGFLK